MSKYNCQICVFESSNKTDYNRHNRTKKHKEKVTQVRIKNATPPDDTPRHTIENELDVSKLENQHKCKYCNNIFTRSSSLTRHMKSCAEIAVKIRIQEKEEIIKEKDFVIKDTELTSLKKEITQLHKQLNTYETMLKSFSTPQTINNFNYICNNYPDTPALEGQKTYDNLIESKKLTLMDVISMYYYDKKLVVFIGDYIVKYYKKDEPKNQSMWATDVSRLTYIIRESCKKNGNIWAYDKKGCKTKKLIIGPALNFIRENLIKFCQENGGRTETNILKQMIAAAGTIEMIDNGELANDISRYIAPEFAVNQIEAGTIN